MENLINKSGIVLWTVGNKKWLVSYDELTLAYINGKYPFSSRELSMAIENKILLTIRHLAGNKWITTLKKIKNYKRIPLRKLQYIKEVNSKLGTGKYAIVYGYNGFAIKVINHRFYKGLPRIDGSIEAKILHLLRNNVSFACLTPCIITMYQYTSSKGTDYIVLEKLSSTFWDYLQGTTTDKVIKGIIMQVLFTLLAIKSVYPGFRHNDLKVDNILLDNSLRTQKITLQYKSHYWILSPEIPFVKILKLALVFHRNLVVLQNLVQYMISIYF
jgi:serine/threonine protein kinase